MIFNLVENQVSLRESAADLRMAILTGKLKPNDRLVKVMLPSKWGLIVGH